MIDARVFHLSQHRACREPLVQENKHSSAFFTALAGAPVRNRPCRFNVEFEEHEDDWSIVDRALCVADVLR
eukprot:6418552-Pyramimonas_sp.AAC.1